MTSVSKETPSILIFIRFFQFPGIFLLKNGTWKWKIKRLVSKIVENCTYDHFINIVLMNLRGNILFTINDGGRCKLELLFSVQTSLSIIYKQENIISPLRWEIPSSDKFSFNRQITSISQQRNGFVFLSTRFFPHTLCWRACE